VVAGSECVIAVTGLSSFSLYPDARAHSRLRMQHRLYGLKFDSLPVDPQVGHSCLIARSDAQASNMPTVRAGSPHPAGLEESGPDTKRRQDSPIEDTPPLRLRVATAGLVGSHPANDRRPALYLEILCARIEDLSPFAASARWLIDFCDGFFFGTPGDIFVQPLEHRSDINNTPRDASWTLLMPAAQLEGAVYEFAPSAPTDSMLFCDKTMSSATSRASVDRSRYFREALIARDVECILTGDEAETCIASHLIPKRLGDHLANSILVRANCANPSGRIDSRLGILLNRTLDFFVDTFQMGFMKVVRNSRSASRYPDCTR
jgi:hypothetical protein